MEKKNVKKTNETKKKVFGFFAYIKHLVKDPVKTITEAKARRKELTRFLLISLAINIIPYVIIGVMGMILPYEITSIVKKILSIPTTIGTAGVIFSGFLLVLLIGLSNALKDLECNNCKERITYNDSVKYRIIREWEERKISKQSHSTQVDQTLNVEVLVSCVCQNCGQTKEFKKIFRTAKFVNGKRVHSYSLEDLIVGYFTGEHVQI